MNNTPDITIDIATTVTLPDMLKALHQQWGCQAAVDGIIDFICDQPDEKFEDMLMAALLKFKEENAPVDVAESINKQIRAGNIKP